MAKSYKNSHGASRGRSASGGRRVSPNTQAGAGTRQGTFWRSRGDDTGVVEVKALTLHPIWAWLVIHGPKRVENRSWATRHRGLLAIHAGKTRTTEVADRAFLDRLNLTPPLTLPVGVILGVVDLLDCVPFGPALASDPLASGPICWLLANPRALCEPFPVRGARMIWACHLPKLLL